MLRAMVAFVIGAAVTATPALSNDESVCSTMHPPEFAEDFMVRYPVYLSFHVPAKYQEEETWRRISKSVNRVTLEANDLLGGKLFRVELKTTPCETEATHKICVSSDASTFETDDTTAFARISNPLLREIPNFEVVVRESFFESHLIGEGWKEHRQLLDQTSEGRRNFRKAVRQQRRALRRERSKIRDEIQVMVIDVDIFYDQIDRLEHEDIPEEMRDARRDEFIGKIQSTEEMIDDKWVEEGRLSNGIKQLDRMIHRVLSVLERTLVHELLHGAGFKHSRDESFIMAASMCIAGYGDCTPDIQNAHRNKIFDSFACMQDYLGWSRVLDKTYNTKARLVHRNAHEDTSKLEDWKRTVQFDERAVRFMERGGIWKRIMGNFESRVKVR